MKDSWSIITLEPGKWSMEHLFNKSFSVERVSGNSNDPSRLICFLLHCNQLILFRRLEQCSKKQINCEGSIGFLLTVENDHKMWWKRTVFSVYFSMYLF